MTVCSALERSYPAERGDPRVGMIALSLSLLTCRTGLVLCEEIVMVNKLNADASDWSTKMGEKETVLMVLGWIILRDARN